MKVTLSPSAGFCIGVKRAIDIALKASSGNSDIFMLGDIIHNDMVVSRMKKRGIKKIAKLGDGNGRILLIRAHGAPLSVYTSAEKAGYKILDATCPMVKEIHKKAKLEERKNRTVIIIGDTNHEEVLGIKGSLSTPAIIIDPESPLPIKKLKKLKKASVVVQSTQNSETVAKIFKNLSDIVKDIHFHDTICNPTKKRQKDAYSFPLENNAVVVIGSSKSANTKRIYQISKSLNDKTFWINHVKEIDPGLFRGLNSVGVLAGASTPDDVIKEVCSFLSMINS